MTYICIGGVKNIKDATNLSEKEYVGQPAPIEFKGYR